VPLEAARGVDGHANTSDDIVASARAALQAKRKGRRLRGQPAAATRVEQRSGVFLGKPTVLDGLAAAVAPDNLHDLVEVGVPLTGPDPVCDAVGEMVAQEQVADLVQGCGD